MKVMTTIPCNMGTRRRAGDVFDWDDAWGELPPWAVPVADDDQVEGASAPSADRAAYLEQIGTIVDGLDPRDPSLWTTTGKPRMDAIERRYGDEGVTREDVEEARPGYRRPELDT